ncbi:9828_t:CDS:1, partial [Paraglomus occultum]
IEELEPSLDKIAEEQNDDEEERMLKRNHQGGNISQSLFVVDSTFESDTIDSTIDYMMNWINWQKKLFRVMRSGLL